MPAGVVGPGQEAECEGGEGELGGGGGGGGGGGESSNKRSEKATGDDASRCAADDEVGDQVGEASKPNTASRDGPRHAADDGGVDEPAVLKALHSRMHLHMEEFSLTQVVEKVVEQVLVERLAAHARQVCC